MSRITGECKGLLSTPRAIIIGIWIDMSFYKAFKIEMYSNTRAIAIQRRAISLESLSECFFLIQMINNINIDSQSEYI